MSDGRPLVAGEVDVSHKVINLVIRNLRAEIFRSDIFNEVSFVQDHCRVIRQHAPIRTVAQCEVGEKQVMVHDDDISLGGAITHARDEARIKVRTLLSRASFGAGIDMSPEGKVFRQVSQFRPITCLSCPGPMGDFFEIIHLFEAVENRRIA